MDKVPYVMSEVERVSSLLTLDVLLEIFEKDMSKEGLKYLEHAIKNVPVEIRAAVRTRVTQNILRYYKAQGYGADEQKVAHG